MGSLQTILIVPMVRSRFVLLVIICLLSTHGYAEQFNYEDLVALIKKNNFTQIESVLAALPEELRSNYTLVYASRSLQGANYDNPRTILFGRDARLIITFNGHPGQRNFDELEVLQFLEHTKDFELRSISFKDKVIYSDKNPDTCLSCHGNSPRPIWASYDYEVDGTNQWPGFYGSSHDTPQKNAIEMEAFQRFKENAKTHPRYRHLKLDDERMPWFPYGIGPFQHQYRPNNRAGNLLARLNAKKIADQILKNDWFRKYENLSWMWLLECPETKLNDLESRFATAFPVEQFYWVHKELKLLPDNVRSTFMLEKLLTGLNIFTWNMSIGTLPGGKRFSTGIVSIDQLVVAALLERLPTDSWLRKHYRPMTNREVYDSFSKNYYNSNVAPGGVGDAYDKLGIHYDSEQARSACPELARRVAVGNQSVRG